MLDKLPMFAGLPKQGLARLQGIARKISVTRGSILFSPGDTTRGFYAVLDGTVRVYRVSPEGKEITLQIADAGDIFAGASVFTDVYHCFAEALSDSTVYLMRKEAFLSLLQNDTRFSLSWIENLSHEVMHLHERIAELSLKSPRARIMSYVLLLSEVQHSALVGLPVHRKSIATLLGMAHETFYRTAKELETEGLLRFDGQKIEILNRKLIEELVE